MGAGGGASRVRWVALGTLLVALLVAAFALGRTGAGDPLTGSLAWIVATPAAVVAAFAIAAWNAFRGSRRVAAWLVAAALAAAGYWLAGAVAGTMLAAGATGSLAFTAVSATVGAGWTVVLALLQALAVVAGEEAGLLSRRTWPKAAILGAAALQLGVGLLVPAGPGVSVTLLPADVASSEAVGVAVSVLVYGWMLSLLAAPIVLFALAVRAAGVRRRGLARVAVGALAPALVVLLCGLLAALVAEALGWTGAEAAWLAVGFAVALPATGLWLSATVHEARAVDAGSLTSIAAVLRGVLWLVYVLGAVQTVSLLTPVLGVGATAGAVAMALTLGATFWPWLLLVRWCVRRTDPRTGIALAAIGAARPGDEPAAALAERTLRDALGDPGARVLVARPGGRWADARGGPAAPEEGLAVLAVEDGAGRALGVVEHRLRFVDLRPLAGVVRPLFERAVWEAELREQAERVAAERARADAAAAEARRRIERDLHDGVQGRLVSLGLGLGMARDEASDPVSRDVLRHAVLELGSAVAELRELSSGTLSRRLDGHGLAGAVGDLAARIPLPVEVDIPDVDLPTQIESTVYFVIAESLTNAVKHAGASRISVRVVEAEALTVVVSDDGRGGADIRSGTGLRGLRERVRAVGGRLVVSDRLPRGTVVEAVLPCGS